MPFLIFQRDHLRSTSGIICGSGSFAVQIGDHFRSGDHLRSGIICGAVQYNPPRKKKPNRFVIQLSGNYGRLLISSYLALGPLVHRHPSFENTCVKCPGVTPGYANAQPPGCDKIPTPETDNVSKCPAVARGGWAPLELIDALRLSLKVAQNSFHHIQRLRF